MRTSTIIEMAREEGYNRGLENEQKLVLAFIEKRRRRCQRVGNKKVAQELLILASRIEQCKHWSV